MLPIIELPAGLRYNGKVHTEVELLKSNGIAEKVFTKKLAQKPYTWQGRVIAVAVKRIGEIEIASEIRKEFIDKGDFDVPESVLSLPLAEVNTLLVEIHRNLWQAILPKQEFICKFCSKSLENELDLHKIKYFPEDIEFIKTHPPETFVTILVYLNDGFTIDDVKELTGDEWESYNGIEFNKLTFRIPLLRDAVKHEKHADDAVDLWRRIAFDCLENIEYVEFPDTPQEKILNVLPINAKAYMSLRLFDFYLSGKDLKNIREELTEYIPTLPFYYVEECPCDRRLEIPHVMEASGFFSE